MRLLRVTWITALAAAGCGSGASDEASMGAGGAGAGGATTTGATTATGQGGAGGAGGEGGGASLTPCATSDDCPANEFCDKASDGCEADPTPGECRLRPEGCPGVYQPACGCDRMVYGNACDANAAGQDLSRAGGCTAPDGLVGCGSGFCVAAEEYCESYVGGPAEVHQCQPLPAACAPGDPPPTCDCFVPSACSCAFEGGGFTLTCSDVPP